MKSIKETHIPTINPEFISEEFDDETLLYTLADTKAVYLNETARLVWEICRQNVQVGEIISFIEDQYPAHKSSIRADVLEALNQLIEIGAITLADG